MNVDLIKIDPDAAKAKLRAYRKAIAERHHSETARAATAEYEQIEQAYRAAARGLALIELSKAMATGGWDEQGRPRFAVWRADQKQVCCRFESSHGVHFYGAGTRSYYSRRTHFRFRSMPPRPEKSSWNGWRELTAIVPMVPPDVLPRPDIDLSRRVILWEADWQDAPVDPLLLLPLGGNLYAVEAAWDLSPLERAVISGRRP
jgi:hypothetical protein